MSITMGERYEHPNGWVGEVSLVSSIYGITAARLTNVNGMEPVEKSATESELNSQWRKCGPAVQDIAKRHGYAYYDSIDAAIGGKSQ